MYRAVDPDEPVSQGDIFDECPIFGPESIVDLRHLQMVPLAILNQLIERGKRRCRLETPYREHLSQHFANTYARIGLPDSYETES